MTENYQFHCQSIHGKEEKLPIQKAPSESLATSSNLRIRVSAAKVSEMGENFAIASNSQNFLHNVSREDMGVIFTPKLGFLTIKFLILIILRP